ncbi:4-carboxymuconolactone decarboxylase [Nocardia sp. CA2R105]|uniref:4-carboxymuconolactone decarboxylase n=1 Tax=Nocardia coffeae TaxID=2873381 RepID=UPI001CA6166A|nr:4-carboxymuconolactone decarboxylase [Nocardia coffeae]MBY8857008.1 4-carboxymuconolactone decarboxylase [Nocardia coffeae]
MRLPLTPPTDLTAEQRSLYDAFQKMTQDEEYQGFEVTDAEGKFVGPWGVLLHFPGLAVPLGQFVHAVQQLPGLSERARQVVILTIGGRFNVTYELYAHARLAARAGLRPDQIAALSAGARPVDLSRDELLAADLAAALTEGGAVPGPLYDTAVETLGRTGLDAVVFIVIHYLALGVLLNAYDVPAGDAAVQFEQGEDHA